MRILARIEWSIGGTLRNLRRVNCSGQSESSGKLCSKGKGTEVSGVAVSSMVIETGRDSTGSANSVGREKLLNKADVFDAKVWTYPPASPTAKHWQEDETSRPIHIAPSLFTWKSCSAEEEGAAASRTCNCPIAEMTANWDENAGKNRSKNGSPTTGTGLRARSILTS